MVHPERALQPLMLEKRWWNEDNGKQQKAPGTSSGRTDELGPSLLSVQNVSEPLQGVVTCLL